MSIPLILSKADFTLEKQTSGLSGESLVRSPLTSGRSHDWCVKLYSNDIQRYIDSRSNLISMSKMNALIVTYHQFGTCILWQGDGRRKAKWMVYWAYSSMLSCLQGRQRQIHSDVERRSVIIKLQQSCQPLVEHPSEVEDGQFVFFVENDFIYVAFCIHRLAQWYDLTVFDVPRIHTNDILTDKKGFSH